MEALAPGELLVGRYRLERVLGAGGMGTVFEATHLQLAQRVAIKVLLPGLCHQRDAVTRFLREARAAVQIESEHVARVMDVGISEGGVPFMVMEYLEGLDLSFTLQEAHSLPVELAVSYVLQAADAIAEAHALGVIHRDLKPSNLFVAVRRDGSRLLKVLDFGISKAASEAITGGFATRTATATVMGSPLYMSPEQVRSSKNVDPRSDIWSLGVILHELIAGEPPFRGESLPGVLASIVADPPTPLLRAKPDAPPAIADIIARCLQKDREQRYANVHELACALGPFAPNDVRPLLARIQQFAGRPSLRSSPPARDSLAVGAPAALPIATPSDTQRGFASVLGPMRERRLGVAAVLALVLAATGFAYVGRGATPGVATAPRTAGSERAGSAPLKDAATVTTETALTSAHWDELEQPRAGQVATPPAPTTQHDDKLFSDRK
jgi:serine/threonine protein kinase